MYKYEEEGDSIRILIGKPEGKKPLVMPRHSWEDNIKLDLTETEWEDVGWIDLAQDRGK